MVHLLHISNTLPLVIHPPQPDVVSIAHSVMVDIEISDYWRDISGRGGNVGHGGSSIPRRYTGGSG